MPSQPTAWDARNTLHALKLWATGVIDLGGFIELCMEIYDEYLVDELDLAPQEPEEE